MRKHTQFKLVNVVKRIDSDQPSEQIGAKKAASKSGVCNKVMEQ